MGRRQREKHPLVAISPGMRRALREKRLSMGFTPFGLAGALGLDPHTICRWEDGRTASCNEFNGRILAGFIKGEYDSLPVFSSKGRAGFRAGRDSLRLISALALDIATVFSLLPPGSAARKRFLAKLSDEVETELLQRRQGK